MYIENIWGVFFCMYLPMFMAIYGAYRTGIEEGKRRYKKHKKAGDYKKWKKGQSRKF